MTAIGTAYDNIRLIRRKIDLAEREVAELPHGPQRDATVIRMTNMTQDLVRALHDFAELGYEEQIAQQISLSLDEPLRKYRN